MIPFFLLLPLQGGVWGVGGGGGGGQLLFSAGQAGVTLITEFTKACVLQSVLETSLGRYTLQEYVCLS